MILIDRIVTLRCRSPCGERGLKSLHVLNFGNNVESLPVRGAWVEMSFGGANLEIPSYVAPRAGSVG